MDPLRGGRDVPFHVCPYGLVLTCIFFSSTRAFVLRDPQYAQRFVSREASSFNVHGECFFPAAPTMPVTESVRPWVTEYGIGWLAGWLATSPDASIARVSKSSSGCGAGLGKDRVKGSC